MLFTTSWHVVGTVTGAPTLVVRWNERESDGAVKEQGAGYSSLAYSNKSWLISVNRILGLD